MCAKYLPGPATGMLSGKLGGVVFSRGRGGRYLRNMAIPVKRSRSLVPAYRCLMGFLSRMYKTLTSVQVEAWIAWAQTHPVIDRLGESMVLSAIAQFNKLNHVACRLGGYAALLTLPPLENLQYGIQDFAAAAGAAVEGDIDLSWTLLGAGDAADFIEICMTAPLSSDKRDLPYNMYKYNCVTTGIVLVKVLSDLPVGYTYYFRARYVGFDGQVSGWQYAAATPKEGV